MLMTHAEIGALARSRTIAPVNQETPTDDALLARFASDRDRGALDQLIQRHWERAYRIAYRVLRNGADAEDCAQDAFARIANASTRYEATGSCQGYLYRVVVNGARDTLKKQARRRSHEGVAGQGRKTDDVDGERRLTAQAVAAAVE